VRNFPDNIIQFQKKHRWLSHVAYWLVVLLVAISSSKYIDGKRATYSFELVTDFLYELPEIAAAYLLTYLIVPQFFYKKRYLTAILTFIVSSYVTCVAARIIIVKICEPLALIAPKAFETYSEISTDILKLLYVYFFQIFSVAFVFMCLKVLKDQLDIQKRTLTLEKEKTETELRLLKTQLNPHFLFNTLNNIYSLSFTSSPVTSESIARLADILDHILYRCAAQYVPLSAEIALIKNYIELEKLRYDKRLTIKFETSIEYEIIIAPLILLSLVENAFKHGASNDTGVPVIEIDLRVNEQKFIFSISNTIAEQNPDYENALTDRIGLNNLRRQLDLIYGEGYTLDISKRSQVFEVILTIDLKHQTTVYEKDQVLVG
jgi:sensor histidine kinase YesM